MNQKNVLTVIGINLAITFLLVTLDLYTKGKFVLWSLIYLLALMNFVTGFIVLLGKKNQAVSITMIFSGLALAMIGFGTCFMTILSGGVH